MKQHPGQRFDSADPGTIELFYTTLDGAILENKTFDSVK